MGWLETALHTTGAHLALEAFLKPLFERERKDDEI